MTQTSRLKLNKPDRTDFAKIAKINENMDILDKSVQVQTLHIGTTGWTEFNLSGSDYTKKKALTVAGLTSNDVVFLNYDLASKSVAQDAGVSHVESENGQIVIYAESVPTRALTATLVVQKGGQ